MCRYLEREIVILDFVYISICKLDLFEIEFLVFLSGEVILNFKDFVIVMEFLVRIVEIW